MRVVRLDYLWLAIAIALMIAVSSGIAPDSIQAPPLASLTSATLPSTVEPKDAEAIQWQVVVAFLRTTAYAEGVIGPNLDPYRTQALSYRQIPRDYAFKQHPYWTDKIIPCSGSLCSACTGTYQFHPDTYELVRKRHKRRYWFNDGDFSPRNQDLAAIYLMSDVGIWKVLFKDLKIINGKPVVERSSFAKALKNGSSEWASFPRFEDDAHGGLGQSAKSTASLWKEFSKQLTSLSGG